VSREDHIFWTRCRIYGCGWRSQTRYSTVDACAEFGRHYLDKHPDESAEFFLYDRSTNSITPVEIWEDQRDLRTL
jgi:hypothetical protein